MPRRGPNVQAARKVYAYECWQQNLSWQDIQKEDRIKFGTQHRKLSRASIKRYVSNGEKLRNAAYVKPKIYKAPHKKTMTVPQKRFMTLAMKQVVFMYVFLCIFSRSGLSAGVYAATKDLLNLINIY